MKLVIIDLKSPVFMELNDYVLKNDDVTILALSPSAFYYLELNNIDYISFHDLITIEKFRDEILKFYKEILKLNENNVYFKGYFVDVAQYISCFYYIDTIISYIKVNFFDEIVYITDKEMIENKVLSNYYSFLHNYIDFTKIININEKSNNNYLHHILKRYTFLTLYRKLKNKFFSYNLNYDWLYVSPTISNQSIHIDNLVIKCDINKFNYIKDSILTFNINQETKKISNYHTFLTKKEYLFVLKYKESGIKIFFFQHGNYLYKNIFIKYYEVELSDINFVFNDYTKKLFKELGAKKVYSVGSMLFNKKIKERKRKYDFLYIIQGHDYLGSLQYIDFPNSLHSFDGYELYQRHASIIKLFGKTFKDKKIVIKVHPLVVNNGLYVPFWELSELYDNITIDVSTPVHNLIEKSKYIISDYFTTEFISRELHYKRDIILFQGAPTPLPKEIFEDMKKMFILVDSVDDLEDKIKNIENIIKNRKRYDEIIEYYSSKNCDTKKIVTDILEKELVKFT